MGALPRLAATVAVAWSIMSGVAWAQAVGDLGAPAPPILGPRAEAAPAAGSLVYVADANGRIATVDVKTKAVRVIGSAGDVLTDIASFRGLLYGISFTHFYKVNKVTGLATRVGPLGVNGMNALVFDGAGNAFGHSFTSATLYRIDRGTGRATAIGRTGKFRSAGDLEFHKGNLLLTSRDKKVVDLNPATGTVEGSVAHNITDLFGLVGRGQKLYGFAGTKLYELNAATGGKTLLADLSGSGLQKIFGAARAGGG